MEDHLKDARDLASKLTEYVRTGWKDGLQHESELAQLGSLLLECKSALQVLPSTPL